jgi:hypothetical protein
MLPDYQRESGMAEAKRAAGEETSARSEWRFDPNTVSQEIRAAAAQIIAESQLPVSSVATRLAELLRQFPPWPYQVNAGKAFDSSGTESPQFEILIYVSANASEHVPADNLACVIDVQQQLGLEELRQSYEKIVRTKSLAKTLAPRVSEDVPVADATMGIIFAVESNAAIETLGEELVRLNRQHPYQVRPDMVVVLSRGTVNLTSQIPYQPLGDFLPPGRGALHRTAMYIHVLARAHPAFALNKMCAVLFPYLYFFQPGVGLPPYQEIVKDMPKTGMPIGAFQFNLGGGLVPVPTSMRFEEFFMFPLSFRVEDRQGVLHAKVQYLPWQDGGVVRVQGQFPIEALLVFAGKDALREPVVRFRGEQTSGVIPMSRDQFKEMANRMARRSNLVIKPDQRPKLVIHERGTEGTSSPFVARLFMGIWRLRDYAIEDKALKSRFDKVFQGVMSGLENLRDSARSIAQLYSAYSEAVGRGEIARVVNGDIYVSKSIDADLRKQVESFINTGSRIVKERMKELLKILGVNIGFLFQKDQAFNNGISRLRLSDPALADYLVATRAKWCERLMRIRNDLLEHGTWTLDNVRYEMSGADVRAIEPLVEGQPVAEFVIHIADRIHCFVEELSAHAFQLRMQSDVSFTEIPLALRKPEDASRFRQALVDGGTPIWTITYHDTKFEET